MLGNSSSVQVAIHYGLGRHQYTLLPENATEAIKWDYISQLSSVIAPTLGRISFAMLLLNLAGVSRFRQFLLYGIILSQTVANSLCFIFISVQCRPIQLLWDKSLQGSCWDLTFQEYYGYFDGSQFSADAPEVHIS